MLFETSFFFVPVFKYQLFSEADPAIRFYPRFYESKSVLSASKLDADFTDSLKRKR